jgi:hypothetical protein
MVMPDTLTFTVPDGYRVTSTGQAAVECERGCGWKLYVSTLSGLSNDAREQLFRYHDAWHAKK